MAWVGVPRLYNSFLPKAVGAFNVYDFSRIPTVIICMTVFILNNQRGNHEHNKDSTNNYCNVLYLTTHESIPVGYYSPVCNMPECQYTQLEYLESSGTQWTNI